MASDMFENSMLVIDFCYDLFSELNNAIVYLSNPFLYKVNQAHPEHITHLFALILVDGECLRNGATLQQ